MATDRESAPTRTDVYTDLFDVLAAARNAEHARYMAEGLLRKDREGEQFDKHGVRESDVDTIWRLLGDVAPWVDAHAADLDCVHPHFRWVLDLDAGGEWTDRD